MELQVDTRENTLIELLKAKKDITYKVKQLPIGDIIFLLNDVPKLIIERKTPKDFEASIKDGRYANQKLRLMEFSKENECLIAYLLEGNPYTYKRNENTLLSALINTTLRDNIPIFQTNNTLESVQLLTKIKEGRFLKEKKELTGGTTYLSTIKPVKSDNIGPHNSFSYFLIQIPRVSPAIAQKITNQYPKLPNLLKAYEELQEVKEKEKLLTSIEGIGKVISSNIYHFLVGEN